MGRRDKELLHVGGSGETQDGAAAEAEFTGDGTQAVAAFDAFVDLLVTLASAGDQGTRSAVDVQLVRAGSPGTGHGTLIFSEVEGFAQVGAVAADDALDGLGEVVQQVPGVGDLLGLRRTRSGTVAEGSGAVAADRPHFGVVAQLVPHQATFALVTTARRRSSAACLFRQMM
ncbi:hypothetical protein [Kitasatospora sp. NPDC051914]|uniref:hypothetical protein n=1 Tax=Kitasatospora sp. NPDC051914 TaxID=3154945 RepID=UPI003436DBB3